MKRKFLSLTLAAVLTLSPAAVFPQTALSLENTVHIPAASEGMSIVVPAALQPGDKVGIVAPANPATAERLELAIELLEERGFEVVVSDNIDVTTEYGLGDGSEQIRADAFNKLARDPDIKALFCLRGGYGAMHLLPLIDYEALRRNRPIIVGYSDITAMQIAILQNAGLVTFHGPMLSSNYGQDEAFDWLFDMLMNPSDEFPLKNIDGTEFSVINEGTAEGIVVGGNLTLISVLMGTEYELDLKDKVLFIEELNEAPYKLHRYIWQLKLAGKLDDAAAIVIGDILPDREYDDPEISLKVIFEALKDVTVPILYNVRAGHGANPFTIPIGATVRIEGNEITVAQSVVEDPDEAKNNRIVTRAEFTAMMMDALDGNLDNIGMAEPFDDVPQNSLYYAPVTNARALGLVSGAGNNKFMPDAALTVQDMLVMVYNALDKTGRLPAFQSDRWVEFDDWDEVAEYAGGPIQALAKMYELSGALNPRKPVAYAESVVWIWRMTNG
ncbi:MAG: LD-carboxypeptidase [Oscillospiraceae bacterium]|nr:LD-carboxypeptidase [Oscillospiraceae bacterium]